jgi:hypothetical protein
MTAIVPAPRVPISIRPATMSDLSFIDSLQKLHGKMVGFMPEKALAGKINAGHVLLATDNSQLATRLGYCIGNDQYFKRDDVGIIYQMNVVPAKQRGLIGATLVKAMFERAAYGCKLFCCWCAQDIEANYFWESLGFVPLAFRAGSRAKIKGGRVHIYWQRRIREGDTTTPYWFPSQTTSGAIREDRLVFPIPPGVRWSDAMPRILPGHERGLGILPEKKKKQCPGGTPKPQPKPLTTLGKLQFVVPKQKKGKDTGCKPVPPKKNDPKLVAAARELRDRWLERVNAPGGVALSSAGKYEVGRALVAPLRGAMPLLEEAA